MVIVAFNTRMAVGKREEDMEEREEEGEKETSEVLLVSLSLCLRSLLFSSQLPSLFLAT